MGFCRTGTAETCLKLSGRFLFRAVPRRGPVSRGTYIASEDDDRLDVRRLRAGCFAAAAAAPGAGGRRHGADTSSASAGANAGAFRAGGRCRRPGGWSWGAGTPPALKDATQTPAPWRFKAQTPWFPAAVGLRC